MLMYSRRIDQILLALSAVFAAIARFFIMVVEKRIATRKGG